MYEYLDRRYALALYKVAEEKGKVQEYLRDLHEICDLIDNSHDFHEVIKHPQISTKKKKQTFINIFKGKIDEELLSFLLILIEKGRILYLKEKLAQMEIIDLERKNTVKGLIKTAVPLLKEEFDEIKEKFEKKYNKTILLEAVVDKSVLGGVYVRIGNDVMDGTIRSKINEMKELVLKKK